MTTLYDDTIDYTTPTGNGVDVQLRGAGAGNTQRITSNGAWDTFDLNGQTAYAHVNRGASFNGNGGILTEDGDGNVYLAGTYAGLYVTFAHNSTANVEITGTAAITNNSTNTSTNSSYSVNVTGKDAGLTITGSGTTSVVGTYKGLSFGNITTGDAVYASSRGDTYLGMNGGYIQFTQTAGTLTFNGLNNDHGVATLAGGGSQANLALMGDHQNASVSGHWGTLSGVVSGYMGMEGATFDNVNIYNTSTAAYSVNLNGSGNGSITYNGVEGTSTQIDGAWKNITATLQHNDRITNQASASGSTHLTLNNSGGRFSTVSGATDTTINETNNSAIQASLAYGTNTINAMDGTSEMNLTLGSGATTINAQSGTNATISAGSGTLDINYTLGKNAYGASFQISNFSQNKSTILINNTAGAQFSVDGNTLSINHNGTTDNIYAAAGNHTVLLTLTQQPNQMLAIFS